MWTAECPFTDCFHPSPLPTRTCNCSVPVRFHPSQSAISSLANDVNREQQQEKATKYDPKQQLRGNQLLEEISVKRDQCSRTPIHPLGNSTDLHFWITYPPLP